jgi:hypothetical protein
MDESAPAAFHQINQTVETFASAYTTPSASNAGNTFQIGARGGAENFPNGNRLAMAMAWEGVALSHAQVMAFFRATLRRFGV